MSKGVEKMGNVIAVIWDCDKTLINGYMQSPIAEFGVNGTANRSKLDTASGKTGH